MALNLPEHRDDEAVRHLLADFPACSELGQQLRQALGKRTLDDMAAAEADLIREQQQAAEIEDRIARMNAEHALRMQYLMHFGVTPEERQEFQGLLEESAEHGGASPREAAAIAHARQRLTEAQRNGSSTGSDPAAVSASAAAV